MDTKSIPNSNGAKEEIEILDGGMGHMIKRLGVSINAGRKGSVERFSNITMANLINPGIVQNAHLAFLEAGCNVITTNNYAATPKCLRPIQPSRRKDIESSTKFISQILTESGFFRTFGETNEKVTCYVFYF